MTKLVIVDGHEALRDGLSALLARRGFDVVGTAGNVAAGLDLVTVAEPDVALIDVHLPDGAGVGLTRQLLALRPALGVVLYSGDAKVELLHAGLDAGARGYALKAGSAEELVAALEAIAGGDGYVDPRFDRNALAGEAAAEGPRLSPREREVMHAMAEGYTAERIGEQFGLSVETIRTHVRNVIRKLQARNRVHAIALALERGEIALDRGGG